MKCPFWQKWMLWHDQLHLKQYMGFQRSFLKIFFGAVYGLSWNAGSAVVSFWLMSLEDKFEVSKQLTLDWRSYYEERCPVATTQLLDELSGAPVGCKFTTSRQHCEIKSETFHLSVTVSFKATWWLFTLLSQWWLTVRYSIHDKTNAKNYICLFDCTLCHPTDTHPDEMKGWTQLLQTLSFMQTDDHSFICLFLHHESNCLAFLNRYSMYLILFLFMFSFPTTHVFLPCMSSHSACLCVYVLSCLESGYYVLCCCVLFSMCLWERFFLCLYNLLTQATCSLTVLRFNWSTC